MHRHAPPYAQARDDYATFSALAERLGVAEAFTEGRDADGWLRHLYEQWRRRYGARPGLRRVLARRAGSRSTRPRRRRAPRRLPRRPGRAPARPPRAGGSSCTRPRSPRSASPTAPATPPGWSRGSGTAPRGPRPTRWCCWPTTRPRACTASWTSARTARRARSPGREPLRMHPDDAAARGLADGDLVRVFNDRGACLAGLRVVRRPAAGRGADVDGRLVLAGR